MPDLQNFSDAEEIKKLLQENKEYLEAIYESSEKTRKYILAGRIISIVYLLLILVPLIFAVVYIPPMIKPYMEQYKSLMGSVQNIQTGGQFNDLDILNQLR